MRIKRAFHLIERICFAAGLILLVYTGSLYLYRRVVQTYLTMTFRPDIPSVSRSAPSVFLLKEGMPLGRLEIPRLGLSVMMLEGASDSTLEVAAGHIPETALPGRFGNMGVAAHRDTFFRPLKDIQIGDVIRLTTYDGVFDYQVEWTRIVKPTAVEVLDSTDTPSLTLVTCYPFYYVGSAPDRFIVRARQLKASASPSST